MICDKGYMTNVIKNKRYCMTSMYKSHQSCNVAMKHAFSLSFAMFTHPVCRLPAANSAICSGAHSAQSLESVSTPTRKKEATLFGKKIQDKNTLNNCKPCVKVKIKDTPLHPTCRFFVNVNEFCFLYISLVPALVQT